MASNPHRKRQDRIRSAAGARRKATESLCERFVLASQHARDDAELGQMARLFVGQFREIREGRR